MGSRIFIKKSKQIVKKSPPKESFYFSPPTPSAEKKRVSSPAPTHDFDFSKISIMPPSVKVTAPAHALGKVAVQPKLTMGQPNDVYEQEADRMAKQVFSMPRPERNDVSSTHHDLNRILRSSIPNAGIPKATTTLPDSFSSSILSMQGEGQSLPESTRSFFEPRFGHDFSQVSIHSDEKASKAAESINAKAFTLGNDIFFRKGEYQTETPQGKQLLAHELTHVTQQSVLQVHLKEEDQITGNQTKFTGRELIYMREGENLFILPYSKIKNWSSAKDVNTAFQSIGATEKGTLHTMKPQNRAYPIMKALMMTQMGLEAQVNWNQLWGQIERVSVDIDGVADIIKAGEWKAPGEQPGNLYIGREAHEDIGKNYHGKHKSDTVVTNDISVKSILRQFRDDFYSSPQMENLSDKELKSKPDILNLTQRHVFEIKPYNEEGGIGGGLLQLETYITAFQNAGIIIAPGATTEPGTRGILPAPGGYIVFISPVPGVIVYRKKNGDFNKADVPDSILEFETDKSWDLDGIRNNLLLVIGALGFMITAIVGGAS